MLERPPSGGSACRRANAAKAEGNAAALTGGRAAGCGACTVTAMAIAGYRGLRTYSRGGQWSAAGEPAWPAGHYGILWRQTGEPAGRCDAACCVSFPPPFTRQGEDLPGAIA